ncbi:MAG: endonuclease/exonuclease/phosphatase family protein [Chthoniobacterales bacterium]
MKYPLALAAMISLAASVPAGTTPPEAAIPAEFTVVTYNVENLFDADGLAAFEDYGESDAEHTYSAKHVLNKMRGIADVLKTLNKGQGPEVIGFNEFEMDFSPESGIEDYDAFLAKYQDTTAEKMLTTGLNDEIRGLPSEALLLKHLADQGLTGYHVAIGADKPDLGALSGAAKGRIKAQKNAIFSKFPIASVRSHPTQDARDILEAELTVDGQPFRVFVNHWKSGASSTESEETRRANAQTLRERLNEILAKDPSADILVLGDFNSQYNQTQMYPHMVPTAVNDILGSQGDEKATATATNFSLYNLWYELPPEERKSDHYRGSWGTLMQKMITPGLYDHDGIQYVDNSFEVVMLDGVNVHTPLGLPLRWSNAGEGRGTSDHFPIAARFRVVTDGDKDRRKELADPGTDDGRAELVSVGYEDLKPADVPAFTAAVAQTPASHVGSFFRVQGRIVVENPLTVEAAGQRFLLFSHDFAFRREIQKFPEGSKVEFLGELNLHRGKWQFIIDRPSWLLKRPDKA